MVEAMHVRRIRPLGRSRNSESVLATRDDTGEPAVLMQLEFEPPPPERAAQDFLAATGSCRELSHPNVARVFSATRDAPGRFTVVREFVAGEHLAAFLGRYGTLPPDDALAFGRSLAAGLACAHEHGLVHGDLRPRTVFLSGGACTPEPRIVDFGLAYLRGPDEADGYRAPELVDGTPFDARADVWAFGAILHEAITGSRPSASGVDPAALGPAADIVARCLAPDPEARFRDARELLHALDAAGASRRLEAGTSVPPPPDPLGDDLRAGLEDDVGLDAPPEAERLAAALTEPEPLASADEGFECADDAVLESIPAEHEGAAVGDWIITGELSSRSSPRAYEVRHRRLRRRGVLEVLRTDGTWDRAVLERAVREAATASGLRHPNLVELYDFADETLPRGGGRAWWVVEPSRGASLTELVKYSPLTIKRGVAIVRQVLEALEAAHRVGLVHGHLGPADVHVCVGADGSEFVTVGGLAVGSLVASTRDGFDFDAEEPCDDVRDAGAILFTLLTGRAPPPVPSFDDETSASGEPIPPLLRSVVLRCLSPDAKQRPPSAIVMRAELVVALFEPAPELTMMLGGAPVARKARRWPRVVLGASAGLLLGGLVLAALLAWPGARPPAAAAPVPSAPKLLDPILVTTDEGSSEEPPKPAGVSPKAAVPARKPRAERPDKAKRSAVQVVSPPASAVLDAARAWERR